MAKDKKNPIAKGLVWIILLLLIVGLAGFGATNFGGSTRVVATVGDTEIDVDRYARALQNELRRLEQQTGRRIPMSEARQAGINTIVLQRLIATAALEDEAAALGLSVGDAEVARSVQDMAAFQGIDGSFDREAYRFALQNAGLSIAEFEEQLRGETSRAILQGALVAGIAPPDTFVDTLYDYAREQRDLTLVRFTEDDLDGELAEPTDADLQAYYDANPDAFTLPERKAVTYAWLSPEMMTDTVDVPEDDVRALYDARSDDYDRPERRLVERLVFPNEEAAQTAADAIEAGDTTFDALVEERGLSLSDIDLGDVAQSDLSTAAAEAVFALDDPGIAGPAQSSLGPALYRVNAILSAQQTPFEDVREELRVEAAIAAARRATENQLDPAEDLLAGGATLEDLAAETEFELGKTVWAADEAGEDDGAIDAYTAFRDLAASTEPGDFPELAELADGGLVALRVDEVLAPELQPLDAVRDQVVEGWRAQALRDALTTQAEAALEDLQSGTAVSELAGTVSTETEITRDAFLEDTPDALVTEAFALEEGAATVLTGDAAALLVRVDAITVPSGVSDEAQAIKEGVRTAAGQGIAADITSAFTASIETQKGISINQAAVNAVMSQFQ
ncbi:Peptidyl-prolyl cis-trans isomerase D [Rhodobacteraceae bacterium THAF1]|uniref:peptidyl-prolyl cis-trans isomerase n=1 Tax=Palleronia sp. THAF1 TaxID=2587842 RepID=UPI000F3D2D15|nr:SurA N-terminal domain-containing protein [Palleronia sp. THAF1]QFU08868.1 Peptidyl-prolyl cis-trans isomerase D [Palleronia sp. THAF1]VDC24420.1 Peptidyl-prolyl cis-trans isomerase D [Rhodobacteraceae bacterium THAF1]